MLVAGGDFALINNGSGENNGRVLNTHEAITGDFTRDTMRSFPAAQVQESGFATGLAMNAAGSLYKCD